MNRRESLKTLGAISAGTILGGCASHPDNNTAGPAANTTIDPTGRQDFEMARDKELAGRQYFDPHEKATIAALADIIIPKDDHSGSASEAGVPDFIEFIVKDEPQHQLPMRGGLRWLDMECLDRFDKDFIGCTPQQQVAIVSDIAYPSLAKPGMQAGVTFFSKMRDLTAIGFFTSKMGIADLGYKGNTPGKWEGVPPEVLKKYGL
ncbi:MAG TPA: gluconate 2-dehydrogenase subunit 3 family protein [Puia sp.]|nr:gluconate 2-dehydrogenase subunit 3 family protein [Puia sp.]